MGKLALGQLRLTSSGAFEGFFDLFRNIAFWRKEITLLRFIASTERLCWCPWTCDLISVFVFSCARALCGPSGHPLSDPSSLSLQWAVKHRRTALFYKIPLSRIGLSALLSVCICWCDTAHHCFALALQYFSFVRKSTSFPPAAERGGERGTECDVPVHCWGEVVTAWQALAPGNVPFLGFLVSWFSFGLFLFPSKISQWRKTAWWGKIFSSKSALNCF